MFAGAAVLMRSAPGIAAAWFACFVVANAIACWLWQQRDRLRPHPAMQLLLLTCGVAGLLAWSSLQVFRPELVRLMGWPGTEYSGYFAVLLIVPTLMMSFALLEHNMKGDSGDRVHSHE